MENTAASHSLPLVALCSQREFACKWCVNKTIEAWAAGYLLVFHVLLNFWSSFSSLLSWDGIVKSWRHEAAAPSCCQNKKWENYFCLPYLLGTRPLIRQSQNHKSWLLEVKGSSVKESCNRSEVFFSIWSKTKVYTISCAYISACLKKIRSFWLFLKVEQGNVGKYKMFSVTSVWDKAMQQLKQVLFGEELNAGTHIL